jgi:dCMP deaminase
MPLMCPSCGRYQGNCECDRSLALKITNDRRPTVDEYFLSMARLASTRATCARRSVGCVLVNRRNHVVATGYNGVASGMTHCKGQPGATAMPCPGADCPSGTGLELCEAIHAEQNALLQCRDIYEIDTCYCTTAPCVTCSKLLMNTGCSRIVFSEDYPQSDAAARLWTKRSGRLWLKAEGGRLTVLNVFGERREVPYGYRL